MPDDARFPGILYDTARPAGAPCRIAPGRDGLEAAAGEAPPLLLPYAGIEIALTGTDDRYVSFAGAVGSETVRILVPDRAILDRLEEIGMTRDALARIRGARADGARRRRRRIAALGAVAVVLALAAFGAWLGFRWAVARAVAAMPVDWERELGRAVAAGVLAETPVCSDPRLNAAVREVGRRLVLGAGAAPYEWRLRVLDSPEVNAFALPGGYVFVHRGLVQRAADGHEVAGVVAHEMEHVLRRHGLENLVREIGLRVVVYAAAGDASAIERLAAANAAGLASMSFSRDQERAADAGGQDLVVRAGLDPSGLERMMAALAADEGAVGSALSFLSTHPASATRAAALAERRRARGAAPIAPLAEDWAAAQAACAPIRVEDPDAI